MLLELSESNRLDLNVHLFVFDHGLAPVLVVRIDLQTSI